MTELDGTIKSTTAAFAEFSEALGASFNVHKRSRSRQCRGKRARNYTRAFARATRKGNERGRQQVALILEDARQTGALANLQRNTMLRRKRAEASAA